MIPDDVQTAIDLLHAAMREHSIRAIALVRPAGTVGSEYRIDLTEHDTVPAPAPTSEVADV